MVAGLFVLMAGLALMLVGYNITQQYTTSFGQILAGISDIEREKYDYGVKLEFLGIILIPIGIVLIVAGAVSNPESEEFTPEKRTVDPRREELLDILDKLDKRLIEGNISEETYKELKTEYKRKLRLIEREDFEEDVGIHKKG